MEKLYIEEFEKNYSVFLIQNIKPTARCPERCFVKDDNGQKFVYVKATSFIQKFYLQRSIVKQKEFGEAFRNVGFIINDPIWISDANNELRVLYKLYENLYFTENSKPIKLLRKFWKENGAWNTYTQELENLIMKNFLEAWPQDFHYEITKLESYKKYLDELRKKKKVFTVAEHGDFTVNNVQWSKSDCYLFDFEFSKSMQVAGMDIYDMKRTLGINSFLNFDVLSSLKTKLCDDINRILDNLVN